MDETLRRKESVLRGETDRERWRNRDNYESQWSSRSSFAAALCGSSIWVCDVGCGMQTLRKLLPAGTIYLPADLNKWTEDTAVCDLNEGEFPVRYAEMSDVLCLLGVVEYIYDLEALIERASKHCEAVVLSYNPIDIMEGDRRNNGWVNDLSLGSLLQLVHERGFVVDALQKIDQSQVILRMRNRRYSWSQKLARAFSRRSYKAPQ